MTLRQLARNAALAALVTLILAIPLVGFTTVERDGRIGVDTRFGWVAIAVGVVFTGRLLWGLMPQRPKKSQETPAIAVLLNNHARLLGWIGLGAAVLWPFLPFSSGYLIDTATGILIYIMLGWGLNIVVGLTGLLNLGYAGFYAVGAYTFALAAQWFDLGFWEALPLSGLMAAAVGLLLGFPVLRLRGDYLAIVTLGFGEIIRIVIRNWSSLTGGPNGINDVPRPTFFGLRLTASAPPGTKTFSQFFGLPYSSEQRLLFLYFVILAMVLITNFVTVRLRRLPIGRAWEALREDEIACRALGINPTQVKLSAFAIGALFAGLAGAFFAARLNFVSPESFGFQESATVLAIVVLGGMGSQLGIVLAAIILVTLPEIGQNIGADFAQFRMLLFGAAMVGIMVWRPRGLLALRAPSIRLPQKIGERA
jgi:branched-chain amino acid transport system permease protein